MFQVGFNFVLVEQFARISFSYFVVGSLVATTTWQECLCLLRNRFALRTDLF